MRAVVGLGNPGPRYATTRHNIGWMVLDAVAESLRCDFRPGLGEYYEAKFRYRGREAVLVKPTTYMNNSGVAAVQIAERYDIAPENMLAIVDELQFPVGRIQLKASGSSGGHNGTESMIYQLGTIEFPRLRCGVGGDFPPGGMVDYVLSPFLPEEREQLQTMIEAGREAVLTWIIEGTAQAMNSINRAARKSAQAEDQSSNRAQDEP